MRLSRAEQEWGEPVQTAVIELGEHWREPVPEQRPAFDPKQLTKLLPIALAVVLLAALMAGSAPVPAPGLVPVGRIEVQGTLAATNATIAVMRTEQGLAGYRFADGRKIWEWRNGPPTSSVVSVRLVGHHVIVALNNPGYNSTGDLSQPGEKPVVPLSTMVLSAQTGAVRFTSPAFAQVTDELIVLSFSDRLEVRRLDTMQRVWELTGQRALEVDVRGGRVVSISRDGVLAERDLATGVVTASRTMEALTLPDEGWVPIQLLAGTIMVGHLEDLADEAPPRYYRSGDLAELDGEPSNAWNFDCQWRWCEHLQVLAIGDQLAVVLEYTQSSARLASVVEPETGRVLTDLVGWTLAWNVGFHTASPLLTHPLLGRKRTYLALLSDDGSLRMLGSVPLVVGRCELDGDIAICNTVDGLQSWRVNP